MNVFEILFEYREGFLRGLWVTVKLCAVVWILGLLVGSLLGIAGSHWKQGVGQPLSATSFILSGIPILVLLFWLHYPLQTMLGVVIDPFYTAVAALALVNTVTVASLVRGALRDFPAQYSVAAMVCGLTPRDTILRIKLPIVLRQILPGLLILQVQMLQATLFASLISVDEIFRVCQRINSRIYKPVEIYTALAIVFLLVCLPLNGLALWLRARFTRDLSER